MKIYILNLERDIQKRNKMIEQLKLFNLENFEFINGCDGRSENDLEEINNSYDEKMAERLSRKLTKCEIATAISHKRAYKKLINSADNGCIIMEDDAIITQDMVKFINELFYFQKNTLNIDIINFGYYTSNQRLTHIDKKECEQFNTHNTDIPNVRYVEDDITVSRVYFKEDIQQGYHLYTPSYPTLELDYLHGLHGYYITKRGAEKFIKFNSPVICESDNVWNYFHEHINGKLIYPQICFTTRAISDVDFERNEIMKHINRFNKKINILYNKRFSHPHFGSAENLK